MRVANWGAPPARVPTTALGVILALAASALAMPALAEPVATTFDVLVAAGEIALDSPRVSPQVAATGAAGPPGGGVVVPAADAGSAALRAPVRVERLPAETVLALLLLVGANLLAFAPRNPRRELAGSDRFRL